MGFFDDIQSPIHALLGRTRVEFLARSSTYLITYKTEVNGFDFVYKATHKKGDELDLTKYDQLYFNEYEKFVSMF